MSNARILLIRHGESSNNVLAEELVNEVKEGKRKREVIMLDWLKRRSPDPALTEMGQRQAQDLGKYLAPILAEEVKSGGPVVLSCSPMLRACMTLEPLATGLAKASAYDVGQVEVLPDIFEVHGHYEGKERKAGACQSAADIRSRFGYSTQKLPASGPWWTSGFESRLDAVARAGRVARRLRSAELREGRLKGRGLYVLVAHADFMDLILQHVLHVSPNVNTAPPALGEDDPTYSPEQKGNRPHLFNFQNTSRTLLELLPDSTVRVVYVGRTEHTSSIRVPSRL